MKLTEAYLIKTGWKAKKFAPAWKAELDLESSEDELETLYSKKFDKLEYLLDISKHKEGTFISIGYAYQGNGAKDYSGYCNDVESFEALIRLIFTGSMKNG